MRWVETSNQRTRAAVSSKRNCVSSPYGGPGALWLTLTSPWKVTWKWENTTFSWIACHWQCLGRGEKAFFLNKIGKCRKAASIFHCLIIIIIIIQLLVPALHNMFGFSFAPVRKIIAHLWSMVSVSRTWVIILKSLISVTLFCYVCEHEVLRVTTLSFTWYCPKCKSNGLWRFLCVRHGVTATFYNSCARSFSKKCVLLHYAIVQQAGAPIGREDGQLDIKDGRPVVPLEHNSTTGTPS